MDFLDFEKLVQERQSCRDFNDIPLEKEKVEKIVELARLAPSAGSVPLPSSSKRTRLLLDKSSFVDTLSIMLITFFKCDENVDKFWDMLCSSPISE